MKKTDRTQTCPKIILALLRRLSLYEELFAISHDFETDYEHIRQHSSRMRAFFWLLGNTSAVLYQYLMLNTKWSLIMLKNYMKITWRNIRRHTGFSFLNISGLAIGIACCLMILLFVQDELSYDRFHENADRIFRVVFSTDDDGAPTNANGSFGVGPMLKQDFPEVIETVRIRKMGQGVKRYVGYKDKKFYEQRFVFTGPSFFSVFDFPLIKGDPETALIDPNTIVLSEAMVHKYFGSEDPMGETIEADPYNDGKLMHFQVTGVLQNIPSHSHLHLDFLASYSSQRDELDSFNGFYQHFTYLLLDRKQSAASLAPKLDDFLYRNWREDPWYTLCLQPLLDIHLHSHLKSEFEANSNILYIYIFTAIALFVLIIACINFMNLTTARSLKRAREVGLRKVVGAHKKQLLRQFLGESMVLSTISALAALGLVILCLPLFNQLALKELTLASLLHPVMILGFAALMLTVGFLAGIYPAVYLSAFQPIQSLKSSAGNIPSRTWLRKGLVTFQFVLSIGIIIATLIAAKQMQYIQSRSPGYDKEQLMVIPMNRDLRTTYTAVKAELLQNPLIENTATSSLVPTRGSMHYSFQFEGREELLSQVVYGIDKDFISTYGLKLTAGKATQLSLSQEGTNELMISELTVKEAEYDSPLTAVGKGVALGDLRGYITGVVNDINIYSLHRHLYSITYVITSITDHNYLTIRLRPENLSETLSYIQSVWEKMIPNYPLEYFFLDKSFVEMHASDKRLSEVFRVFSILAIIVACLGLFGLAAYTAEQKTKEIGIRKVLGASVPSIYLLLTRELLRWVVVANLIAWPVAYYVMRQWLQNFVFRTEVGIWIFLAAGAMALVIALLTISFHAFRAAAAQPINALRYE